MSPRVFAFAVAGVLWVARGALGATDVSYYHPTTAVDHAAVLTYSLALGASAVALLLFNGRGAVPVPRAARMALIVSAIGGIISSIANFGEDWLGVSALSFAYVVAVIPFYVGVTAAGFILFARSPDLRRVGVLMLVPFFAQVFGPAIGYALGGAALITCAALLVRRPRSRIGTA